LISENQNLILQKLMHNSEHPNTVATHRNKTGILKLIKQK